jgi:hypothetical protein
VTAAFVSSYRGRVDFRVGGEHYTLVDALPDFVANEIRHDARVSEEQRAARLAQETALIGCVIGSHRGRSFPSRDVVAAIEAYYRRSIYPSPVRLVGARYSADWSTIEYDGAPPECPERAGAQLQIPAFARWWNALFAERAA